MSTASPAPGNGPVSGLSAAPADALSSITQSGFTITTRKLPILKAGPIEEMTQNLKIAPPEMIFGDNLVRIENAERGWWVEFNAYDALDKVDKTGESMLKVSYSSEWQRNRQHHSSEIKEVVKPFDWSYTTDYQGTAAESPAFSPTSSPIPLHLLKQPDPILFFDDVMLFEDELADNGITILSVKIRVMPSRLLLLSRFFMRLDGVLVRLRDTRIFVEFKTGEVIREYCAREEKYDTVRDKLKANREDVTSALREPAKLVDLLPIVDRKLDGLLLK